MAKVPEDQQIEELNMTPMIDVIFQLLIFFMCAGSLKSLEGKLQSYLPKDKGLNPTPILEPELREVRIILRTDGRVVTAQVEQRKIADFPHVNPGGEFKSLKAISADWDRLGAEVKGLWGGSSQSGKPIPVKIDAADKVPFQYVVSALDACLRQGVKDIEFIGSGKIHEKLQNKP